MADTRTDPQLKLRISASLKETIDKHAEAANRSINQEVIFRLMQAYAHLPDFEAGSLQNKLATNAIERITSSIDRAERQLNIIMLHVFRGDHPDTWGGAEYYRGHIDDGMFEAMRAYSEELGPSIPMMDLVWMCAERWLVHIGRLQPRKPEVVYVAPGADPAGGSSGDKD